MPEKLASGANALNHAEKANEVDELEIAMFHHCLERVPVAEDRMEIAQ